MTTMEIRRTNGTMAQVAFEYAAADTYEAPSLFTVKTREVEIRNASVMTRRQSRRRTGSYRMHPS